VNIFERMPPILTAVIGMGLLTVMDALVKAASDTFDTPQIVFLRFAIAALMIGVVAVATGAGWPRRDRLKVHMGRALLMLVTASSFFYALGKLPLADVFALSFTSPIFVALFATVFLKERVRPAILGAIGAGFVGMLVIVFGGAKDAHGAAAGLTTFEPLALTCALLSPVTYALSVVLLRAQTAQEPVPVILATQMAVSFKMPTGSSALVLLAIGTLGAVGNLAFAAALKRMTAARFSVVEYTGLIWAAAIGYLYFGEKPRPAVWVGAGLIIAGCLLVLRERAPKPQAATK
jgi:drug/metabolite transporter (DMT)-like permease